MSIIKPTGDQEVVSSVKNSDTQDAISDVLDVPLSEKELTEKALSQELGDKIFLQMQGEYKNIIPKEQKEKFWTNEKKVFNKLYALLAEDMKNNATFSKRYEPNDPLVAEILSESNFLFVNGEFDGLRCKKWIAEFYDEDLASKPKGRKGFLKPWEREYPYKIYTDRKDGEIDKAIYVSKRLLTPKDEKRRFSGRGIGIRTH